MKKIDMLFDLLDDWRHLPSYQLERRADIFFALYLQDLIEAKVGYPIKSRIIPEFPVRIGSIYPETDINKSYKIDYAAVAADAKKAVLIELKTEGESRRQKQDQYLVRSQAAGFRELLKGIIQIFRATNAKRKYYHLLLSLEEIDQLYLPKSFKSIMQNSSLRGSVESSREIQIISKVEKAQIIYIQPNGEGEDIINFREIAQLLEKTNDALSNRFAKSLHEWSIIKAGTKDKD